MPGGGEEHANLEGAEVIDVGGGLGVDQALSPPVGIFLAKGNGQGGGAATNAPVPSASIT